jgi:PAS domain S-box-containing protein
VYTKDSDESGKHFESESLSNEVDTGREIKSNFHDEQMLRNILAACPVGLCRVEDRTIGWVNEAMLKMFGYVEEDFVGKSTRMTYASDEEYERVGAILYLSLQGRTEVETDAKLIRKDGSIFDGHIRISAADPSNLTKGTVVAITDRTPIKEAEAAIMESERRFREILENVDLVAICLDNEGKITFCNDFLLEITGWRREEVLGRDWFDTFVPGEEGGQLTKWHQPLPCDGMRFDGEKHIVTKSGNRRCIRWNTTVLLRDPLEKVTGVAAIGEDITDRKQANALLLRTERIKAVGEMAGAVAHNFNNLLQIVMSGSQVAMSHLGSKNVSQAHLELEKMVKTCELGAQTVKRLQEFARVRPEDSISEDVVFDLSQTIQQAVEMTRPWWKTNPDKNGTNISLALDLSPECLVSGRENELFEVAVNLIKNAVEALPTGGHINVRAFPEGNRVVFQVQDDGFGIAEVNLGKVFQPFWTTKGFRGTGMGLSSSYGIVTGHGGEMSVESTEREGSIFVVRLPQAGSRTRVSPNAKAGIPDFPFRILLVDDTDTLLATIADGLTLYGQKVFTATSGLEALAIFNHKPIDVVICDLGMEGMNGLEVSREIQELCLQKGVPKTPFILLTGWGDQIAEQHRVFGYGVDRVVSKPTSIFNLLEALQEVVDENEQRASRRLACRYKDDTCIT